MMNYWLIGAGEMAINYAKVLQALGISFEVIGRGESSANNFSKVTSIIPKTGGVSAALKDGTVPDAAIIAVCIDQLSETATTLIEAGTRHILIEKPGGLNLEEIYQLNEIALQYGTVVWLAYNRRFYASILKAEELIADDGGATSLNFEFTEWSHKICNLSMAPGVKENWFLGNSTHVVDLAFYLCGVPAEWKCWHAGSLDWHPAAARYCGAGMTDRGVLFSYMADWDAPGRWGLEVLTRKRRFIMRPMENLQITMLGSVQLESVELDDKLDHDFKPGLYRQTAAFINNEDSRFCTLSQQVSNVGLYVKMGGYKS